MATLEDVAAVALALPETTQDELVWSVRGKVVVKERRLRPADLKALGDDVPDGPVLMVHTGDLVTKDEMLRAAPGRVLRHAALPRLSRGPRPARGHRRRGADGRGRRGVAADGPEGRSPTQWLVEHPDGP